MIKIRVQGILAVRDVLGTPELTFAIEEGSTLAELLARLARQLGGEVRPTESVDGGWPACAHLFLVNGQNIHFLTGYQTVLADQDTVTIIPLVGGG
ncbi:MAG TPA: MoaD/ThiS family protein [Spirochaetia bacterium]|nr:MoaD/ThiS family protein [Spirochaetia bacterium]